MSNTDSELLSYEDRQKWFRYHIHNSKVSEENAWKQINKMIRMLYKDYLNKKGGEEQEYYPITISPFYTIIEKIYNENQDMFRRIWKGECGGDQGLFAYDTSIGLIYRNLDETNKYLIETRYLKINNIKPDTEEKI